MITLLVQRRPIVGEKLILQPIAPDPDALPYPARCLSYRDTAPGYGEARLLVNGAERRYAIWLPAAPTKPKGASLS